MSDIVHSGLTVSIQKRADQGVYEFGVEFGDQFISFASRKTGGIDDQLELAKAAEEAAAAAAPAPPAPSPYAL